MSLQLVAVTSLLESLERLHRTVNMDVNCLKTMTFRYLSMKFVWARCGHMSRTLVHGQALADLLLSFLQQGHE